MAQWVGRRALIAEVQVRSQATPDEIRGGRSDSLTGFRLSTSDILIMIPLMLHTRISFFYRRRNIILENESFDAETLLSHQIIWRHIPEGSSHTLILPLTK